jgi:hypothetical protein
MQEGGQDKASFLVALVKLDPSSASLAQALCDRSEDIYFRAVLLSALCLDGSETRGILHKSLERIEDSLVWEYRCDGLDASGTILGELATIELLEFNAQPAASKLLELMNHPKLEVRARSSELLADILASRQRWRRERGGGAP